MLRSEPQAAVRPKSSKRNSQREKEGRKGRPSNHSVSRGKSRRSPDAVVKRSVDVRESISS